MPGSTQYGCVRFHQGTGVPSGAPAGGRAFEALGPPEIRGSRRSGKDLAVKRPAHSRSASPISEDLAAIIGAMPAAVVLLRDRRNIAEVSGRFASVFGRPLVDLLGSDLLRFVAARDAGSVDSVIEEARSATRGSVPASVVARFEQPDGSRHIVEVSAAHRVEPSSRGATVVLLRPQTIWHGLNAALVPHRGGQSPGEPAGAMEVADAALETIVGMLSCEPVAHDCYFLRLYESADAPVQWPEIPELADVPRTGPWEAVLAGKVKSVELEVASLAPELQEFAQRRRFTGVRCVPVRASHRDGLVGCLVAWDRKARPLFEIPQATFSYAAEMASLAIGRIGVFTPVLGAKPEPWPSDVDVVTGLPLEAALFRSLDEMMASGERPGLICIRLDALAELAETLGDFTRDQLIRVSARRVSSLIRMTDELYRTGADGLVVLCTGPVDGDRVAEISTRVKERLAVPFRVDAEAPVDVHATVASLRSPAKPVRGTDLYDAVRSLMP